MKRVALLTFVSLVAIVAASAAAVPAVPELVSPTVHIVNCTTYCSQYGTVCRNTGGKCGFNPDIGDCSCYYP